jgi:hypothetical protein
MKIKLPQLLGGIAALTFILTNFLYLVNWFVADYGDPGTEFKFWIWPFTALIQIAALLMFTLLFNNKIMRYIAAGVFVFMRLIHSLFWMDYTGPGIFNSVKVFFGRLYEASTALENIATLTGILSFIIFVVAVVMSFINLPQKATPARQNTEGEAA